jgi:hypothetical protein
MSLPPEPPGDAPVTEPDEPPGRRRRRAQWAGALTIEDFRSVRRWLVVIGITAVLGTAIGIFALVKAYESEQQAADRERVVQLERTLRTNLAELETALSRAGEEADVARLGRELRRRAEESDVARVDRRLRRLEAQFSSIQDAAADTQSSVDNLSNRVSDLADELEDRRRGGR